MAVPIQSFSFNQEMKVFPMTSQCPLWTYWFMACGCPKLKTVRYQRLVAFMVDKAGEQWFENNLGVTS